MRPIPLHSSGATLPPEYGRARRSFPPLLAVARVPLFHREPVSPRSSCPERLRWPPHALLPARGRKQSRQDRHYLRSGFLSADLHPVFATKPDRRHSVLRLIFVDLHHAVTGPGLALQPLTLLEGIRARHAQPTLEQRHRLGSAENPPILPPHFEFAGNVAVPLRGWFRGSGNTDQLYRTHDYPM
jgi:hypothetical protein